MKKIYLLLTLLASFYTFGQGLEDFTLATNLPDSSYEDGSFVGNNGITWTYTKSRDAQSNTNGNPDSSQLPALMLQKASANSKIVSSSISGGIGDFSVKLYKQFTGGGDRQVELFINGTSYGTSVAFDDYDEHIFTVNGINISGDIVIEIRNTTAKQIAIDDITWTGYSNSTSSPSISITSPSDGESFTPDTTDVSINFVVQNFTVATAGNGDGHIQYSINGGSFIDVFDTNPIELTGLTPQNYTIEIKLVDDNGDDLSPAVSNTVNFEITDYTQVATLSDLRAGTLNEYYHFTGEAFLTAAKINGNGTVTAYLQDSSAAIAVYVPTNLVPNTTPNLYDGIADLKGKLIDYNGTLEISLSDNYTATGNNQPIIPEVVSIEDYTNNQEDYESELIKIENVTIDPNGDTEFKLNKNYTISDGTNDLILRTNFPTIENETIPLQTVNVTGIAGEYKGAFQIYPRGIDDIETVSTPTPALAITSPFENDVYSPDTTSVQITFTVQNFEVASSGKDGHIQYSINGGSFIDVFDTNPIELTGLTPQSYTIEVKLVDDNGNDLSPAVSDTVTFKIADYTEVTTLEELRKSDLDEFYHFTGEAYLTAFRVTNNGSVIAYLQDATAGISVFVPSSLTPNNPPSFYDGITDLKGKLIDFKGTLEISLSSDFTATGNNQPIEPQIITIEDYQNNHEDYESELIKIENVTINANGDTEFKLNANYTISDGTNSLILRTAFAGIENKSIPVDPVTIVGIAGEYNGTLQVMPRNIDDVTDISYNQINGLKIYPNPVIDNIVYVTSNQNTTKQITIYNVLGKEVLSTEVNNAKIINLKALKAGIYMMKIKENDRFAIQKLIIK